MPENNIVIKRNTYTTDFKQQIVELYNNGKRKCDIIKEYGISPSILDK